MLEKMGWREGCGLGARLDGPTSHILVSVKDDFLGIGATRRDVETAWLSNSKSYQEVLNRLAKSMNTENSSESESERMSESSGNDSGNEEKAKKKDKKDKKVEKKRKEKKEKKSSKETTKKDSIESTQFKPSSITTNARAHRAKFIRNKAVSAYSQSHLQEILGGINV